MVAPGFAHRLCDLLAEWDDDDTRECSECTAGRHRTTRDSRPAGGCEVDSGGWRQLSTGIQNAVKYAQASGKRSDGGQQR